MRIKLNITNLQVYQNIKQLSLIQSDKLEQMQRNYDYVFKFVIIGSSSVGKSSILKRFADDCFQQSYISTIGIDFRFKSLNIGQDYVKLQIWDTAGQERFRGITKSYYKGANAVILVCDINNIKSFEDLEQFWVKQTKQYADNDKNIFCFVNKCDDPTKQIPQKYHAFLQQNSIECFKVSAKTGQKVHEAIIQIAQRMMQIFPKVIGNQQGMDLKETKNKRQGKKCCN